MIEAFQGYFPAILIAVLIGFIVGFLIFRPRQQVRLTDSTPLRPHMAQGLKAADGDGGASLARDGAGFSDEIAAAAGDVTGEFLGASVNTGVGEDDDPADDLQRLKGVGPKLAQLLESRGYRRFEQLARLGPDEIERLDLALGAFKGRISRDRIVEQAAFLARGDEDGFQQRFGKL